jgi:PAS domain S-box-containing protein
MKKIFQINKALFFAIIIAVLWVLLVFCAYIRDTKTTDSEIYTLALNEARAYYTKDVFYINWTTFEGGVYVPVSKKIQSNPNLEVSYKQIETKDGKKLTLVNPAYLASLVHEPEFRKNNVRVHLVGLTPIRPENKADEWEQKALESFEKGNKEFHSLQKVNGDQILRYLAPLFVEESCLKCHAEQSYKVGDVSGGISVAIPYSHYSSIASSQKSEDLFFYSVIALLGLAGLHVITSSSEKHKRELAIEKNKLLQSDERLQLLSEVANEGILIHNDGIIFETNKALEKLIGYSREELIGKNLTDISVHPEDREELYQRRKEHFNEPYKARIIKKTGEIITVLFHGYSASFGEKSIRVVSLINITRQELLENELRESEEKWRSIIKTSPDGITIASMDGIILQISDSILKIFGYTDSNEIFGKHLTEFIDLSFQDKAKKIIEGLVEGKHSDPTEYLAIKKDGTSFYAEISGETLLDRNGTPINIIVMVRDITDRKQAEFALENERQRLENIIEGTRAGTWEWNVQTGETIFNETWAQIIGYTLDELKPISIKTWEAYGHPEDVKNTYEVLNRHFNGELPCYDFEFRMKHKNGNWVWIHDRGKVISWTEDSKPLMMLGTHTDITERKITEEKLRQSEERHRLLVDNSTDVIWTMDLSRKFTYVSPSVRKFRGYTADEVMNQTLAEVLTPDSLKYILPVMENLLAEVENGKMFPSFHVELEQRCKNGSTVWTDAMFNGMYKPDGEFFGILGVSRDITQQRIFQQQLVESEEKMRLVIETSPVGIFYIDSSGKIQICNSAFSNIIGAPKEKIIGVNVFSLPNREVAESAIKAIQGEKGYSESLYTSTISGKKIFLRALVTPVYNFKNDVIGGIAIVEDFSERKKIEEKIKAYNEKLQNTNKDLNESKKLLEKSLADKNKLVKELTKTSEDLAKTNSEKDKLFSIIAHDLRSPFQGFISLTEIVAANINDYTLNELSMFIRELNSKANNLFKLLRNLLEWSKMQRGNFNFEQIELDLYELAVRNIELIKSVAEKKDITIINNIKESQKVFVDENMINSVFSNLFTNAIKFTNKNGRVIVSSKEIENKMIEISIEDTGIGMSDSILNNLFKIQKKGGRKGTDGEESSGLGLLLCKEFIEKHSGTICAEGSEGEGSKFVFTLPLINK